MGLIQASVSLGSSGQGQNPDLGPFLESQEWADSVLPCPQPCPEPTAFESTFGGLSRILRHTVPHL